MDVLFLVDSVLEGLDVPLQDVFDSQLPLLGVVGIVEALAVALALARWSAGSVVAKAFAVEL